MIDNPKQQLFEEYFTNPESETFGVNSASMVKAGFAKSYAENITVLRPDWYIRVLGKYRNKRMVDKSIKNLEEVQGISILRKSSDGEMYPDKGLIDSRTKVDTFITERLGKDDGWSTRTEMTGADGKELTITFDTSFNEITPETTDNS